MFTPESKQTIDEGEWSREARFQRNMNNYCKDLPSREEITRRYRKERDQYMKSHKDEKFVDTRPFTAGSLGRDSVGTGDFTTVSQFVWDNHRLFNMREERPKGPAYERAKTNGKGLEEGEEEHLRKIEELKAKTKMMDTGEQNMSAVSDLLKSIEEGAAKKKRLVPSVHKPYEWDADNPNDGIPWPDVSPGTRAKGPAYDRSKANSKSSNVKTFDEFTGTWIIPSANREENKKHLDLNYNPRLNAYVKGDLLSGLRSKKRHNKILEGMEYLAETKLDDVTKAEREKQRRKRRADEEYERAKQAVAERKMLRKAMTEKLAKIGTMNKAVGRRARPGRSGRRPRTAGSLASSNSSIISHGSYSTASSFHMNKNDKDKGVPDILVIDHPTISEDEKKEAETPKFSNADIEMWEGTRVKTPLWAHFGRGGSAGHTPFARLGSAGQEKFGGWMRDLRALISRGGGENGKEDDKGGSKVKSEEKSEEREPFKPAYVATGGTKSGMPQSTKSIRPAGRRRNRKNRNSAPLGDDGSMIFEEQSLESLSLENSAGEESSKKKKKKRKKKADGGESDGASSLDSALVVGGDDDTIVSMLSNEDSFGTGSIGSFTMISDITDPEGKSGKKRRRRIKKKKKKKRGGGKKDRREDDDFDDATIATDEGSGTLEQNLSAYVNSNDGGGGDVAPIASFEFIDDLSLSSRMGTVKNEFASSEGRYKDPDMHDVQRDARSAARSAVRRQSRRNSAIGLGGEATSEIPDGSPVMWETGEVELGGARAGVMGLEEGGAAGETKRPVSSKKALAAIKKGWLKEIKLLRAGKSMLKKKAERVESFLIRKKLWKKEWRVSGRDNYDQGAGFAKANSDAMLQTKSFTTRLGMAALYGLNVAWARTSYASYMLVYLLGGPEAATTMGLRDFLIRRSLSPEEMLTAASDGERSLVMRALTQIKDRVKVDVRDYAGKTALMCAIEASSTKLSPEELRDWSRSQRKQRLVRFLRGRGSTPDNPKVIEAMREKKYNKVLELLLLKGADINAHCLGNVDENVTPLHLAVMGGEVKSLKWILAKGGKINVTTESKVTPLHMAAKLGKCEAAAYLLTQDADMIAKTDIGWTPLHFAAYSGGTVMVKMLLKAGADKRIKDNKGRTAADLAAVYGNRSSFEVLRKWNDEGYNARENLDFLASKMGDAGLL